MCAGHITEVILLKFPQNSSEEDMISTFLWKIRGPERIREVRSLAQGPTDWTGKAEMEHIQLDIKVCVIQTKPVFGI